MWPSYHSDAEGIHSWKLHRELLNFSAREFSMDWRFKAILQLAFSTIPKGERLNHLCQRYVTRSIPGSEAQFGASVSYAKRHLDAIQRYFPRSLDRATFYEFGAGWD